MKYIIPEEIVYFCKKTTNKKGQANSKLFNKYVTDDIQKWFDNFVYSKKVVFNLVNKGIIQFDHFVCGVCGNHLTEDQITRGQKYCCKKCSSSTEQFKSKIKQTNLKKYGTEYPCQNSDINDKRKKSNVLKYGKEHPCQNQQINCKRVETNIRKYHTEHPCQCQQIKQRIVDTNIERYGVANVVFSNQVKSQLIEKYGSETAFGSTIIRQKSRQTIKDRYGVDNPMQCQQIKHKAFDTNVARYGHKAPIQNSEIYQKVIQTLFDHYGVSNPQLSKQINKKSIQTRRRNYYDVFVKKLSARGIELVTDRQNYINNIDQLLTYRCNKCGHQWQLDVSNPQKVYCCKCSSKPFSAIEKSIVEYIRSLCDYEIIQNDRQILNGKQLDIYIPQLKLAFEFNGNYWHCDKFKQINYHQQKTIMCAQKGIKLIHIFEYQYINEQQKVKALIRESVSRDYRIIYARKCKCDRISNAQFQRFCEEYHFDGSVKAKDCLGLFYEGQLVSVVGFGKSRYKSDEIELYRYCCKSMTRVIGGFSKLIKHSGYDQFVSYVDYSHFSGNGYIAVGFEMVGITRPNYVWTDGTVVYSRMQTQKHKLGQLLKEQFNDRLSQNENMTNNNFMKIYDAGNLKMKYKHI